MSRVLSWTWERGYAATQAGGWRRRYIALVKTTGQVGAHSLGSPGLEPHVESKRRASLAWTWEGDRTVVRDRQLVEQTEDGPHLVASAAEVNAAMNRLRRLIEEATD